MSLPEDTTPKAALPATRGGQFLFDTSQVAERDRLDAWQEQITRNIAAFELRRLDDLPFFGRIELLDFGPLRVHREYCSPVRWRRTSREIRDGVDSVSLFLGASGPFNFRQGVNAGFGDEGHFAITDHARESDMQVDATGTDYDVTIERDLLRRSQRDMDGLGMAAIGPQTATLRLLRNYIDSVLDSDFDLSDPQLRGKIGDHMIDLIVLGLRPTRDAQAEASERGLRAARLRGILDVIGANFRDERLSVPLVASRLNISERYLHRLLEEHGLTFSRYVLELRLRRAANLLVDPEFDVWRIGQIAYDCGFSDLSYFNRCFRRRFGDTPAGVRSGKTVPF